MYFKSFSILSGALLMLTLDRFAPAVPYTVAMLFGSRLSKMYIVHTYKHST